MQQEVLAGIAERLREVSERLSRIEAKLGINGAPAVAPQPPPPDSDLIIRMTLEALMKRHPRPGMLARAVHSAAMAIIRDGARDRVREWCEELAGSHSKWVSYWKKQGPQQRFVPMLHTWIDNSDYATLPEES